MASGRRGRLDRSAVNICLKYFLFFVNFALFLVGLTVVGLGIWVQTQKTKKVESFVDILLDPSISMMLISGGLMVVISFFGCVGPLRENIICLKIYSFLIGFFLFVQVVAIVFIFLFYFEPKTLKDLNIYPEDVLSDAITNYRDDPDQQNFIDGMQESIGCCGVSNTDDGYKDWNNNMYFNCSDDNRSAERCSVPWSCCILEEGKIINLLCGSGALEQTDSTVLKSAIHTKGCLKGLGDWIGSNVFLLGGILLGLLIPQILAFLFAKNLAGQIKLQKSKW